MSTRKLVNKHANDNQPSGVASPRLSLRDEQKLMSYNRLLDAALAVFKDVGYKTATIDQIAAEAGANRATFYLHFKDKMDLAAGLGRRVTPASAHEFLHLDSADIPTLAQVKQWLVQYVRSNNIDRMLSQMLNEALAAEPAFAAEYLEFVGRIADRMTKYLSRWTGKRRQIARSKIVIVELMLARYMTHMSSQGLTFPGEHVMDALAESVWCTLYAELEPATNDAGQASDRRK